MTSDVIKRLEEAEVGSRELDREVWKASGDDVYFDTLPGDRSAAYTRSLDAAVALVERVLPGINGNSHGYDKGLHWPGVDAFVSRNNVESGHWIVEAQHATSIPLALCIALLKAVEAQGSHP
jgi:hypothetical protein